MKDALGHGSDTRGGPQDIPAHQVGVHQIGRGALDLPVFYHGSPIGEPGPTGPVHLGTLLAAKQALEARIGIPADGKGWTGDREYGKTLLAGTDTLAKLGKAGYNGGYPETGYNAFKVPKHDYYAPDRTNERATMGKADTPVPFDAKPSVARYAIVGQMTNTPEHPMADSRANGLMKRSDLKRGVYYTNTGEGGTIEGGKYKPSISAVVPNRSMLRKV